MTQLERRMTNSRMWWTLQISERRTKAVQDSNAEACVAFLILMLTVGLMQMAGHV